MSISVSVIVPCFNQGMYLLDLIESVNDACSSLHEIIVIDDGSTDLLTHRYLKKISAKSSNQQIHVINQTNGGLAAARNTGLNAAKGQYIQFLDADDLLTKGKIDHQVEDFEKNPAVSIHLTEYVMCNRVRNNFWYTEKSTMEGFSFDQISFIDNWERGLTIPIHSPLFCQSAIGTTRFNENFRAKEDWLFWIELAGKNLEFKYSSFVGAVYRIHNSNMCKNKQDMGKYWMQAVKYLSDSGIPISTKSKEKLMDHYNKFYGTQIQIESLINHYNKIYQHEIKKTDATHEFF